MVNPIFAINGVDYSSSLLSPEYDVRDAPVFALRFTDTDGVDHAVLQRHKTTLSRVQLKIYTDAQVAEIVTALKAGTLQITFYHPEQGIVTKSFRPVTVPPRVLTARGETRYWYLGAMTFEEL